VLLIARGPTKWIDLQVAETKVHQRLLPRIIDTDVGLDELLGFSV